MINNEYLKLLNELYYPLCLRSKKVLEKLIENNFNANLNFYNGHYKKDETGNWQEEFFPIPVISILNICDIEFSFDGVTISTKLSKEDAIKYDFTKLNRYKFEVYGVKEYLNDMFNDKMPLNDIKENIQKSEENEIGISFILDNEKGIIELLSLIKKIKDENFYY